VLSVGRPGARVRIPVRVGLVAGRPAVAAIGAGR
jgi:hypothetical protein